MLRRDCALNKGLMRASERPAGLSWPREPGGQVLHRNISPQTRGAQCDDSVTIGRAGPAGD